MSGHRRRRAFAGLVALAAVVAIAAAVIATRGGGTPAPVRPVPHAATAGQQARNLEGWLREYSR